MVKNIIANIGGRLVVVLSNIAIVPLYIGVLGVDGYGVINAFAVVSNLAATLEAGLPQVLSRDLALNWRQTINNKHRIIDLIVLVEWLTLILAVVGGIALGLVISLVSHKWLGATHFDQNEISSAAILAGVLAFSRLNVGVYQGCLQGVEKLFEVNVIQGSLALAKLAIVSVVPKLFLWKLFSVVIILLAANIIESILLRQIVKKTILHQSQRFSSGWQYLAEIRKQVYQSWLVSVTLTLKNNADRLICSMVLDMKDFGAYSLFYTIGMSVLNGVYPIVTAAWPELVRCFIEKRYPELKLLYKRIQYTVLTGGAAIIGFAIVLGNWVNAAFISKKVQIETFGNCIPVLLLVGIISGMTNFPHYIIVAANSQNQISSLNICFGFVGAIFYFIAASFGGAKGLLYVQTVLSTLYWISLEIVAVRLIKNSMCEHKARYLDNGILKYGIVTCIIVLVYYSAKLDFNSNCIEAGAFSALIVVIMRNIITNKDIFSRFSRFNSSCALS